MKLNVWIKKCILMTLTTLLISSGLPLGPVYGAQGQMKDSKNLWLVNRDHSVSKDYVPEDLTACGSGQKMRKEAAQQFEAMMRDLTAAGIRSARGVSGYRTYSRQTYLFNTRLAQKQNQGMSYEKAYEQTALFTAVPGTSEHQLGMAMDISVDGSLTQSFGSTEAGQWLAANSWKYGFILRYQTPKVSLTKIGNEPWHFRYVGTPHAQIMYEKNWCLEEYIEYLHKNKTVTRETGDGMVYEITWTQTAPSSFDSVVGFSSDNAGGYIVTSYYALDPMAKVYGHWSEPYFQDLLSGKDFTNSGAIDPDRAISRGDYAMLYSMLPIQASGAGVSYEDVFPTDRFYEGVTLLSRAGIMQGNQGKFSPHAPLTREAAAVTVAAALPDKTIQRIEFSDLGNISGWAFQPVQQAVHQGLIQGKNGMFLPKEQLTWGEAAALLSRLKGKLGRNPSEARPPADWPAVAVRR